jgi:hypothetical protein
MGNQLVNSRKKPLAWRRTEIPDASRVWCEKIGDSGDRPEFIEQEYPLVLVYDFP